MIFKAIGHTNSDGKTIMLFHIKNYTAAKLGDSGIGQLIMRNSDPLSDVILLDDMKLVIPEAPHNTNFAIVIDSEGKVLRRYLKVGD